MCQTFHSSFQTEKEGLKLKNSGRIIIILNYTSSSTKRRTCPLQIIRAYKKLLIQIKSSSSSSVCDKSLPCTWSDFQIHTRFHIQKCFVNRYSKTNYLDIYQNYLSNLYIVALMSHFFICSKDTSMLLLFLFLKLFLHLCVTIAFFLFTDLYIKIYILKFIFNCCSHPQLHKNSGFQKNYRAADLRSVIYIPKGRCSFFSSYQHSKRTVID